MPHYAALDVSNDETAIHVVDETGATVWCGKRASDPQVLATALRRHAPDLVRLGLETGPLTPWLYHTLKELGLPIICLDARHARAATALQRNKTDARDAETLAQVVRMGWYREARVKSYAAHAVRHLVGARAQLMGIAIDLSNQVRSTLKTFGLMAGKGAGRSFENRVRELIAERPTVAVIVEPLLSAWRAVRARIGVLDRRLIALAKGDATCRLLMTARASASSSPPVSPLRSKRPSIFAARVRSGPISGGRRHDTNLAKSTGRAASPGAATG